MTGNPVPGRARLDSWKEIALYLDRDVRTVQRWQRDAGLPVHHVANGRVRSVFAFADEIDTWLTNAIPPVRPQILEAELALLAGDDVRGLHLIEELTPILIADSIRGTPEAIDPVLVAEALNRTGRPESALRVLEQSVGDTPGYNGFGVAGAPWLRARIALLRMLTRTGHQTRAARLEEELRGSLSQAEGGCALVAQFHAAGR